jgi:hypothetical protein
VQGHGSYLGDSARCGLLDFYFYLDEAKNTSWSTPQSRSVCSQRDFHFSQSGPQGGIGAVKICATDTGDNSTTCTDVFRSQDPSNAEQDLPTLPDYDIGA